MHSFDSLARSLARPAPRRPTSRRATGSALSGLVALGCALVPLVTMVQVYADAV